MELERVMESILPLVMLIVPFFIGGLCLSTYPFRYLDPFLTKIKGHKMILVFGTGLTLAIVSSMVPIVLSGEGLQTPWLSLQVDLSNIAALVAVAAIFFLASIYTWKADKEGRLKPSFYTFFVFVFLFCMLGLLTIFDLFVIFLLVELLIGVSIILVVHAPGKLSPEASFKYLIITAVSALFVLTATLLIYMTTGTSNLLEIANSPGILAENARLVLIIVVLLVAGIGADIGLVPFHGWLPDVFPASTPVVNIFFCAEPIALILALYKVVSPFYEIYPSTIIVLVMAGVGVASMVFGSLLAYTQKDALHMIAYISIDTFGTALLALGLFTPLGAIAGQIYIINGALMKTGILLCLGSVYIRTGIRNMNLLGGLFGKMKKTALTYLICILSLVGIPPLSGFYAKWLIFNSVYSSLLPQMGILISVAALVLLVGFSIIPFIILMRSFTRIFLGTSPIDLATDEVDRSMWLPGAVLAGVAVLIGIVPGLLLGLTYPI
jgi:formate hydrogenlyase subunit 3/multisubunit Na+/H+ antiporter MnhD subunit